MLTRRGFLVSTVAAGAVRSLPMVARAKGRWIVKLVYDKGLGSMRVVERWVP